MVGIKAEVKAPLAAATCGLHTCQGTDAAADDAKPGDDAGVPDYSKSCTLTFISCHSDWLVLQAAAYELAHGSADDEQPGSFEDGCGRMLEVSGPKLPWRAMVRMNPQLNELMEQRPECLGRLSALSLRPVSRTKRARSLFPGCTRDFRQPVVSELG